MHCTVILKLHLTDTSDIVNWFDMLKACAFCDLVGKGENATFLHFAEALEHIAKLFINKEAQGKKTHHNLKSVMVNSLIVSYLETYIVQSGSHRTVMLKMECFAFNLLFLNN